MNRLISVSRSVHIFPAYRDTPIGLLLEYHNLARPHDAHVKEKLLIGTCIELHKRLRIPDSYASIIHPDGATHSHSDFEVSYAIAVHGIRSIALIGHNQCGMVNLAARKGEFIQGLVEHAGWERRTAEEHFHHFAERYESGDEVDFVRGEARRLRSNYPKIQVAPMIYRVEDGLLYQLDESDVSGEYTAIDNQRK